MIEAQKNLSKRQEEMERLIEALDELTQKAQKESEESPKASEEVQGASQEESKERVNIVFEVRGERVSILRSMSKVEICALVLIECSNMLLEAGEKELLEKALETAKLGL